MDCAPVSAEFYAGCDLHDRALYVVVVHKDGSVARKGKLAPRPDTFLRAMAPYRHSLAVGCEVVRTRHWLADLCEREGLPLKVASPRVLGPIFRALGKDDLKDAYVIAQLLRAGLLPEVFNYPRHLLGLRQMLRARLRLVRERVRVTNWLHGDGFPDGVPTSAGAPAGIGDEFARAGADAQASLLDPLGAAVGGLDAELARGVKQHFAVEEPLLRTIPGVGPVVAATLLLEIGDIRRFGTRQRFRTFCRLAPREARSAGRAVGLRDKAGNGFLRWALGLAAVNGARHDERLGHLLRCLRKKSGPGKAEAILAGKLADAVWMMLRHRCAFDVERFRHG